MNAQINSAQPTIVPPSATREVRAATLAAHFPVAGEPLRLRFQGQVYLADGTYRNIRESAWIYEISSPTIEFGQDVLEAYDSMREALAQHGPAKVKRLLEAIS